MPSPSHEYRFGLQALARTLAAPAVGFVVLAACIQFVNLAGRLRQARPADMDRTILAHQAAAAAGNSGAEIVLLGDSSGLMDVAAGQLERELRRPVLSLATISHLGLAEHGRLLQRFAASNSGRPRQVILLLHPEALRRPAPVTNQVRYLEARLAGRPWPPPEGPRENMEFWLGKTPWREGVLERLLPAPLPGEFGSRYGFTADLWAALDAEQGSLQDPRRFAATAAPGSGDYRLAPALEAQVREFRARLPAGSRLWVGITPVPQTFASREHAALVREQLGVLARWLAADHLLTQLPATLPDDRFASTTHLNATGAAQFTAQLAELLRAEAAPPPP
jgi:hypothetical protein